MNLNSTPFCQGSQNMFHSHHIFLYSKLEDKLFSLQFTNKEKPKVKLHSWGHMAKQ